MDIQKSQQETITRHKSEVQRLGGVVQNLTGTVQTIREQAFAQAQEQIRKEMREAVASGDTAAFAAAESRENRLHKSDYEARVRESQPAPAQTQSELSTETQEWLAENQWFKADPQLARHAIARYGDVKDEMPGASEAVLLVETRKRMVKDFPAKFGVSGNGAARPHSPSPQEPTGARTSRFEAKGPAALPADVRAAMESLVKQGLPHIDPRTEKVLTTDAQRREIGRAHV